MIGFKPGDRVVGVRSNSSGGQLVPGGVYDVVSVNSDQLRLNGVGTADQWFFADRFRLADPPKLTTVPCVNDTDGDGDCHLCVRRGGCEVFLSGQVQPPKPPRTVKIRGAFAIDADGKAVIEATGNGDEKALRFVQDCCERHIHSGFFNLVVEIPEPVELTATVGDVK